MHLLDANIFLELQLDQKRADEAELLLEGVRTGKVETFVTDLILDTILIVMEARGKTPTDLEHFLASVASYRGLRLYFLSVRDRLEATRLMSRFALDFEDATLVQVATRLKVAEVVSFDKDFDHVTGLKRLEPRELAKRYELE